jgi:hypothetical protein
MSAKKTAETLLALGKREAMALAKLQAHRTWGTPGEKFWHKVQDHIFSPEPTRAERLDKWDAKKALPKMKSAPKAGSKPLSARERAAINRVFTPGGGIDDALEGVHAKKPTRSKRKAKPSSKPKKAAAKDDRAAKVWAWLKKTEGGEYAYDAKLWTPDEWRKHGSDPGSAVFVITTEGPLYQLVNGHFDAPAADKLLRDFNKMLKSLGLWYDMGSAVELYFYDK